MNKIVLLPLDERPCNYDFPHKLFQGEDIDLVLPSRAILGDKKKPADLLEIQEFLLRESRDANYLVLSMEMLLYGGLLPSRLHQASEEEVGNYFSILKQIREENPKVKIYVFSLIMRCPSYSSADEEPDYYEICGKEIHQLGILEHLRKLDRIDEAQYQERTAILSIEKAYLEDYRRRRDFNLGFVKNTIELLEESIIDFMLIPQDDSAPLGFTAMDQKQVRTLIRRKGVQTKCLIYPGADEIALTLLARVQNDIHQQIPNIHLLYGSVNSMNVIPLYEDRSLHETMKYHIMASGAQLCASEQEADFVVMVTAPPRDMLESSQQFIDAPQYMVERNLSELVYKAKCLIAKGKKVVFCDNAYANGGEVELMSYLMQEKLLFKLAGYAGWNTSSNTAGTALAMGIQYLYQGDCKSHRDFLVSRYVEDVLYCGLVRESVTNNQVAEFGYNYFDVSDRDGVIAKAVQKTLEIENFNIFKGYAKHILIESVEMPWRRMFEVKVNVVYRK